jgi:N-acetylneuraminate synthase
MPYIIAEIGINFEGNINKAIKLIKIAKKCGVNAVKFQVFKAETLAAEKSKKTLGQKKNTIKNES